MQPIHRMHVKVTIISLFAVIFPILVPSIAESCTIDNNAYSSYDGGPIMLLNGVPVHYIESGTQKFVEASRHGYNHRYNDREFWQKLVDCHTVRNINALGRVMLLTVAGPDNILAPNPRKETTVPLDEIQKLSE